MAELLDGVFCVGACGEALNVADGDEEGNE